MASIQEKLNQATIQRSHKLFDRHISKTAVSTQLLRLQRTKVNIRGDWADTIVSTGNVQVYIDMPPDMPLSRARLAVNPYPPAGDLPSFVPPTAPATPTDATPSTNLNFWDLLPIWVYCKWGDNIVKDDLVLYIFQDENHNPIPLVLRITDDLGAIHSHLVWRKLQAAVENSSLTTDEMTAIQTYLLGGPPASILPSSLTLNLTTASLAIAGTLQLVPTLLPIDATNQNLVWSSASPAIAVVSSSGLVTAISAGVAVITATTQVVGLVASCTVTVA